MTEHGTATEPAGPPRSPRNVADELHRQAMVVDVHSDVHLDLIRRRAAGETRVLERRHLPGWRAAGLDAVVLNTVPKFGPDPYPYLTTPVHNYLYMLDCLHEELAESNVQLHLVRQRADLEAARDTRRVGIVIGLEGSEPLGTDLSLLRCYHRLGLRVLTLTWHQRNVVADGVAEPSGSGLSNFGRDVVREANRLGLLLDVSHVAPAGVADVLERSEAPVIASHSNARALCDHNRNLTDEQIRAIADGGGLIGIAFLGRFVAERDPALEHVVAHVEHVVDLVGYDHVALGPDFTSGGEDLVIGARRVAGPGQPVDEATIPYARGLQTYEKLPDLTARLLERGHASDDLRGLLGGNFLRLLDHVVE